MHRLIKLPFLITAALTFSACSGASSENQIAESQIMTQSQHRFISSKDSAYSYAQTLTRLKAAIAARPLKLFAEIDHAAGAKSVDLNLNPSTLFIFGNPKGGTPLMQANANFGLELPLKILVIEEDGNVKLIYQDVKSLAKNYGLDTTTQPLPNVINMIDGIITEVTVKS